MVITLILCAAIPIISIVLMGASLPFTLLEEATGLDDFNSWRTRVISEILTQDFDLPKQGRTKIFFNTTKSVVLQALNEVLGNHERTPRSLDNDLQRRIEALHNRAESYQKSNDEAQREAPATSILVGLGCDPTELGDGELILDYFQREFLDQVTSVLKDAPETTDISALISLAERDISGFAWWRKIHEIPQDERYYYLDSEFDEDPEAAVIEPVFGLSESNGSTDLEIPTGKILDIVPKWGVIKRPIAEYLDYVGRGSSLGLLTGVLISAPLQVVTHDTELAIEIFTYTPIPFAAIGGILYQNRIISLRGRALTWRIWVPFALYIATIPFLYVMYHQFFT